MLRLSAKFNKIFSITLYSLAITLIATGISLSIVFTNDLKSQNIENLNLEKEITKEELVAEYKSIKNNVADPVLFNTFQEAVENAKQYPTSFVGKLTHYGPDCATCGGHLSCNGQDARNGNIYYNDSEYGTLRIVAASKLLPCGSIIKINVAAYDKDGMYAIVLDRGVGSGVIDLLKTSEKADSPARTVNNATIDIIRYGY